MLGAGSGNRIAGVTGRLRRRVGLLLLVAAAVTPIAPAGGSAPAEPRRAQPAGPAAPSPISPSSEELRTATSTTYRLDPAGGAVHVTVRATLTNRQPDVVSDGFVRQFFLDRFGVPALAEAEAFVATHDGRPLTVTRVPIAGVPIVRATIDLVPNLYYGATQTIELSYRIPARPPRSDGFSRVNAAFVTFPVFPRGDPFATDVEVIVPAGLEADVIGGPMERSVEGDAVVFRAARIADPDAFLANVVARDDDALVSAVARFGEHSLTVLGWPGDDEWTRFVADKVERGVPELEALIGIPWPGADDLEVVESASPYLYGYAGWYAPSESLVEIGDGLDAAVVLHELSHVWFNQELFGERWINEGLAEVYSARALDALGEVADPPSPVNPADPGRIALTEWSSPDLQAPISAAQEAYGYNAAHVVLEALAEEIGIDGLSRVLAAASSRELAYPGDGDTRHYSTALGWRELLDHLEGVGGSATAATVFADLVLTDALRPSLLARAAARARYDALVDGGSGWIAPRGVRQAMAHWRFDDADALIDDADSVLEVRRAVVEILEAAGLGSPTALEAAYEGALTRRDLSVAVDGVVEAAGALAGAAKAEDEASGPLAALGTLGGGAADRFGDARSAFAAGAYGDAAAHARAAIDAYRDAATTGAVRLLAVVLVLALVAGLLVLRRRTRARRAHVAPAAEVS